MAILISSAPIPVGENFNDSGSKSSYETLEKSKQSTVFGDTENKVFQNEKTKFKNLVIAKAFEGPDNIKIGEHYLLKISDLKALFEASPDADYLHLHNTLDDTNSTFLYAIPSNSKSKSADREILTETSILLAAFPCPPDPRCPKF